MRTIKIFFLTCGIDGKELTELLSRQTPGCKGRWGRLQVVDNPRKADYHIVWGTGPAKMYDPKRTIFMEIEPPHRSSYMCEEHNIAMRIKYSDGSSTFPSHWFLNKTYDELKGMAPPKKDKRMSCILSYKTKERGRKLRVRFAQHMCTYYPDEIDLYGSISQLPQFEKICLGGLGHSLFKDKGLLDYRYHLTMENGQSHNYFSEKLVDPLLMWCLPIYWGPPNIKELFPDGSYVWFNVKDVDEADRIVKVIHSGLHQESLQAISDARDLILDKYNFWPTLHRVLTGAD